MVYRETGKTNIAISINNRMANIWTRLHSGKQTQLSVIMHTIIKAMYDDQLSDYKSDWIAYTQNIFDSTGFSNV